jgi:hypothetical protein
MTNSVLSVADPRNESVTLEAEWYVRHGFGAKSGPAIASAFEIQAAIERPADILTSNKDTESLIYVREVGTLRGEKWFTLVVTSPAEAPKAHVVATAYNAKNANQKGRKIWSSSST